MLRYSVVASLVLGLLSSSCYHYHIRPERVKATTEPRSQTQVAYFWGLMQPNDVVPPNCPLKVPLAQVTSHTNFGYVLLGTLTLGTVLIQTVEWRCASLPGEGGDILQVPNLVRPRG